jgi:uncharacterized protein
MISVPPGSPAMVLTLLLGACGGILFYGINAPLPWLIGAMVLCTMAAFAGAPLSVSSWLRTVMITVIGVMLGSAFRPETFSQLGQWAATLSSLVVYLTLATAIMVFVYHRKLGLGPVTSFFSAAPGGLMEMVLLGKAMGGDLRTISLVHSVRIMLVVFIIPFWFRLFEGYEPRQTTGMAGIGDLTLTDAGLLVACAAAGLWVAGRLRLPAAPLIGPMIFSAAVHMAGLTAARPPLELVAVAQVVFGTSIGCRFVGVSLGRFMGVLTAAFLGTVFLTALSGLFAFVLAGFTGIPFAALLLAFSPGGLPEMSLITLAMGIDIAFVSTHHLSRIVLVIVLAPIAFSLLSRWLGISEKPRDDGD